MTRSRRLSLRSALRSAALLVILRTLPAHADRPLEVRAEADIEAASSLVNTLQRLGLIPESLRAAHSSAHLTLSATGTLADPRPAGKMTFELRDPEMHGFQANIGWATATFFLAPDGTTSRLRFPNLHVVFERIVKNIFGFDIRVESITLDGSGTYLTDVQGSRFVLENSWEMIRSVVLDATPARLAIPRIEAHIEHLASDLQADDPVLSLNGTGAIPPAEWRLQHPLVGNVSGTVEGNLSALDGTLHLSGLEILVNEPHTAAITGDLDFDLSTFAARFDGRITFEEAVVVDLVATATPGDPLTGSLSGNLAIGDIEALWPVLAPYLGEEIAPWLVGGSAHGTFAGDLALLPKGPKVTLNLRIEGEGLQGLAPDATIGWSGASFVVEATSTFEDGSLTSELDLNLLPSEVLLGGLYLSLAGKPIRLSAGASGNLAERAVTFRRGLVDIAGGALRLACQGEARLSEQGLTGWLATDTGPTDFARLYRELAPAVLHEASAAYALSGLARLAARFRLGSGLVVEGTAELDSAGVSASDPPIDLTDIDLSLPYRVVVTPATETRASTEPSPQGTVRIGSATFAGVPIPPFDFHPILWDNRFALADGLELAFLDGNVSLSRFEIGTVLDPLSDFHFSGSVRDISLETLCRAFDLPVLQGNITLRVPEAKAEAGDLMLPGETNIQVFDGSLRIQDLRIEDFRGISPILAFSADFEGLNLGEITSVIPIGRMEGAVKGYAHDFRLSLDPLEPYSFDVQVETDDRAHLRRTISFEAVRTVVSVGNAQGTQFPWMFRFFDRFTYRRLGLHVRLKNDNIRMEGLIRKGNQSYFLLGSGTARINLIAQPSERGHPYRRIVRTLQSRIQKIQEQGLSGVRID